MVACLFAVALLAFVVHQAHGSPRCFLMVSSKDVNKAFGPHGQGWKEVTDDGYGPMEISSSLHLKQAGRTSIPIRGSYNETRGCIVGGYSQGAQHDENDGALTRTPNNSKNEWPKGYVIPLDYPIHAPFLGRLIGNKYLDKSTYDFTGCYKFGQEKNAEGVVWHYKTDRCRAFYQGSTRPTAVVSSVSNGDHSRSLQLKPLRETLITFYSTPMERIQFGTASNGVHECVELAKKKNLEAKYVSWNRSSHWCFRSTEGGLVPMFDDINNNWETVKVNLAGAKLDSSTFKCKPKA